jgi:hypothetical protein
MFSTGALRSIKTVFQPFNHPLPLSKHEQQKLLKVLTTSFRKHLDREHGPPFETAAQAEEGGQRTRSAIQEQNDRSAVDRHLRAILSNPLFRYDPNLQARTGDTQPHDPRQTFDEGVHRGTMTIGGALAFLQSIEADIVRSPSLSRTEAMCKSHAGLQVLRWLRASGQERDLTFIANKRFSRLLLDFMIAEGLEPVAWTWLVRLARNEVVTSLDAKPAPLLTSIILSLLVEAKKDDQRTLDEAYSTVLRGDEILSKTRGGQDSVDYAWSKLSWTSTVDAWKRPAPSPNLYDSFVAIVEHLRKRHALDRAHLDVHHPTRPDPTLALAYLNSEECHRALDRRLNSTDPSLRTAPAGPSQYYYWSVRTKSLALDTVGFLVEKGSTAELQYALDVIRTRLDSLFSNHERQNLGRVGMNLAA